MWRYKWASKFVSVSQTHARSKAKLGMFIGSLGWRRQISQNGYTMQLCLFSSETVGPAGHGKYSNTTRVQSLIKHFLVFPHADFLRVAQEVEADYVLAYLPSRGDVGCELCSREVPFGRWTWSIFRTLQQQYSCNYVRILLGNLTAQRDRTQLVEKVHYANPNGNKLVINSDVSSLICSHSFQVQFLVIIIHNLIPFFIECSFFKFINFFLLAQNSFMLVLFLDFYRKTYSWASTKARNEVKCLLTLIRLVVCYWTELNKRVKLMCNSGNYFVGIGKSTWTLFLIMLRKFIFSITIVTSFTYDSSSFASQIYRFTRTFMAN